MADYTVGDTTYAFPDSMSDDQVKSVLTQKGIIKAPVPATNPRALSNIVSPGFWSSFASDILPSTVLGKMGGVDIAHGAQTLASGGSVPGGAADILEGGMKMASPMILPELAVSPLRTLLTLGGGMGAGLMGNAGARMAGADPDQARLAGDVSGIAGGAGVQSMPSPSWTAPEMGPLARMGMHFIPGGNTALHAYDVLSGMNPGSPEPEWSPYRAKPGVATPASRGAEPGAQYGGYYPQPKIQPLTPEPTEPWAPLRPKPGVVKGHSAAAEPGAQYGSAFAIGPRSPAAPGGGVPVAPEAPTGFPEPGAPFRVNPRIKAKGKYTPGGGEQDFGPAFRPTIAGRPGGGSVPAPSPAPASGDTSAPIPTPGGSPVPSNAATFKHPAQMTDLIRQFHATWPKGVSLRDTASKVYGTPAGTMPNYDQALAIHEYMLKNGGKAPASLKDLGK